MKHRLLCLAVLVLSPLVASAEARSWVSFDVPETEEEGALAVLAHRNIDAIGWTNAVVDVSDFGPLRVLPLKDLDRVLTDQDPRRDPWLAGIGASFRPREGVSRLWVASDARGQAAEGLGSLVQDSGHGAEVARTAAAAPHGDDSSFTPRQITAWTLVLAALLFLIFRFAARSSWPSFVLPAAGLLAGAVLLLLPAGPVRSPGRTAAAAPASEVSWLRHRWFQEAYPWGAAWKDWTPGKPWVYPSFERKDGRIASAAVSLPVPDQAWADAAYASLDPHHAARIFPRENP